MSTKLFVGKLPYSTTDQQLTDLFSKAGMVVSAKVISDKFSGQSRGFAFVEMGSEEEAKKAIAEFNNYSLDGRTIVVNEARPQEERPSQGFVSNRSSGFRNRGGRSGPYRGGRR